jgi:plastocyanin
MTRYDSERRGQGRLSRRTFLQTIAVAGMAGCASWLSACGGGEREATGAVISMTDQSQLVPALRTIKVGETVTWRNKGTLVHSVTTDPRRVQNAANVKSPAGVAPWDSGTIAIGGSWSRRFDAPGEYRYCCVPHEFVGMVGTLVVEA